MKTVFVNYNMHLFTGLRNPSHRIFQVRYMSEDKINKLKEASPIADSKAKLSEEDEEKKKVLAAIDPKELHAKFIQNHMSFEDARAAAQKAYSLQKQSLEDRFEGIKSSGMCLLCICLFGRILTSDWATMKLCCQPTSWAVRTVRLRRHQG